jgi:mRNA interferase MazF
VLTRSDALPHLTNATVAPLTRSARGIPSEVRLTPADGVPTECAVSVENILTIPQTLLDGRIASLSAGRMGEVFDAIRYVFALPDP